MLRVVIGVTELLLMPLYVVQMMHCRRGAAGHPSYKEPVVCSATLGTSLPGTTRATLARHIQGEKKRNLLKDV